MSLKWGKYSIKPNQTISIKYNFRKLTLRRGLFVCLFSRLCVFLSDLVRFFVLILKNRRLKSQHEQELREMERTERQTREKYMEARTKLAQLEGDVKNLHVTINQMEIQLTHSQKVRDTSIEKISQIVSH